MNFETFKLLLIFILSFVCVYIYPFYPLCACLRPFTVQASSSQQFECQGADQRYCVEDVSFLCQVPSSLPQNEAPSFPNYPLYPAHTIEAGKSTAQLVCVSFSNSKAFIYQYQASLSVCATSLTNLSFFSKVGISLFPQPRIYIWLSWKNKIKV